MARNACAASWWATPVNATRLDVSFHRSTLAACGEMTRVEMTRVGQARQGANVDPDLAMTVSPDKSIVAAPACPACGADVQPEEIFCTRCGGSLSGDLNGQSTTAVNPAEISTTMEAPPFVSLPNPLIPERRGHRERRWLIGLGVVTSLLAVALGLTIFAWQQERSAHQKTSNDLTAARAQIDSLQSQLATTKAQLARTEALSARQRAILDRTAVVLAKVEPLLSGADDLKQRTNAIQSTRDDFSIASDQLVNDLITLSSDLINAANYYGVDVSYLSGEIDTARADIESVDSASQSLSSADSDYNAATQRFSNRASGFTTAVRALQRELRQLKTK